MLQSTILKGEQMGRSGLAVAGGWYPRQLTHPNYLFSPVCSCSLKLLKRGHRGETAPATGGLSQQYLWGWGVFSILSSMLRLLFSIISLFITVKKGHTSPKRSPMDLRTISFTFTASHFNSLSHVILQNKHPPAFC